MGKTANIKFNGGIIHTPSDVSPVDGDLNECINLVPSDGELKPVEMPVKTNVTSHGGTLAAVHSTENGKMLIFIGKDPSTQGITIVDEDDNIVFQRSFFDMEVNQYGHVGGVGDIIQHVNLLGNTIILFGLKRTYYVKWTKGAYKWLGGYLPKPVFDFKLQLDVESDNESSDQKEQHYIVVSAPTPTTYDRNDDETGALCLWADKMETYSYWHLNNKSRGNVVNNLKSKIAKLQSIANERNVFLYPFYVRYALKLYDGSYVMHSAPILMLPSTYQYPICASINWYRQYYDGGSGDRYDNRECNMYLIAKPSKLMYKFVGFKNSINQDFEFSMGSYGNCQIEDWDDIIKSVDIFISKPTSQMEESYYDTNANVPTQFFNYKGNNTHVSKKDFGIAYSEDTSCDFWDYFKPSAFIQGKIDGWLAYFMIHSKGKGILEDLIANENMFYKAVTYQLSDLKQSKLGNYVYFNEQCDFNTLGLLDTKQILPDDYINLCNKTAQATMIYNKRLILANLNIETPLFYPITETGKDINRFVFTFVIEKEQKTIYIRTDATVSKYRFGHYIYYPDVDCKEVIVYYTDYAPPGLPTIPLMKTLKMTQHKGLNGAYAIMPDLKSLYETLNLAQDWNDMLYYHMPGELPPATSIDRYYLARNAIFMSLVLNPFVFSANSAIEVGSGSILGVATTPIPMSEGQYGQYPLIVFTDNGIHAVGIANDGTFTGVSPVSSADSIMNAPRLGRPNIISDGQSLYFITKRGLMEMRGLQVRCVSEVLNGGTWKYSDYRDCVNPNQGKVQYQNIVMLFGDGIKNSRTFNQAVSNPNNPAFLAFDYKHNRILVTNPSLRAHWLYSITDHKWCKMIFNDNYKVDDKSAIQNISQMMSSGLINVKNPNDAVDGRDIVSAVFDWNASYLQTSDGELWDLMGAPDENDDAYYKYGFIASRPIRLGSDEHKSIIRLLHRERINSQYGFRGMRLYGSVDGIRFYEITSLHGASYKYFVVLLYTCMKANERYSYMSVEFEERFQNKLR